MPNSKWHWPLVLVALIIILKVAEPVLVPVLLAALLAQLLIPMTAALEKSLPKSLYALAPLMALSVIGMAVTAIVILVSAQIVEPWHQPMANDPSPGRVT